MHASEFDSAFRRFATSRAWQLCSPQPPALATTIAEYEQRRGVLLPAEYHHVATTVGTGEIGFVPLYSVSSGLWSIESQRATASLLSDNFLPISDNGCGDFYGFVINGARCEPGVYFADHESGYAIRPTEFRDLFEYLVRYAFRAA